MSRCVAAFLLLGLCGLFGCAANVLGAQNVGGSELATWVYIQTDKEKVSGVFRCTERDGEVVCQKAKLAK